MGNRVSDLSVDELRIIIRDVVTQTLNELFRDPDEGLALQPDFMDELERSLIAVRKEGDTLSAESVAERFGLNW